MFGDYDVFDQVRENGLPNAGENVVQDGGVGSVDGFFSKIGSAVGSVVKVAVPAVQGYASGGYSGAISGAVQSFQKPASMTGGSGTFQPISYQAQPQSVVPSQQYLQQQRYLAAQEANSSFLGDNPWVMYAGGGLIALLVIYNVAKRA